MADGPVAQPGLEDSDPDIYTMEAVQCLLELLGDREAGREVERAEALLDGWLRSRKLVAWAIKRGCAEPAEVDPRAWRNHWLDWRTGRTVKVSRGGTGRPDVFWGSDGEYRDVHFDRNAFLQLAHAELDISSELHAGVPPPSDCALSAGNAAMAAETSARPCVTSSTSSARSNVSFHKVEQWYKKHLAEWPPLRPPPTREQDVAAAKAYFAPKGVSRDDVRKARKKYLPLQFQKSGRRKLAENNLAASLPY